MSNACEQGRALAHDDPILFALHGWACGKLGRREQAERALAQLLDQRRSGHASALLVATCYVGLDNADKALEWIETAYDERDGLAVSLRLFVWFDPLRKVALPFLTPHASGSGDCVLSKHSLSSLGLSGSGEKNPCLPAILLSPYRPSRYPLSRVSVE